jgi:predicted nucleic-acid-binding protein
VKARPIDANVILRFLAADHPEQSARCRDLFERVQNGRETISIPEVAFSEVVWTLKSFYQWPNDRIRHFLVALLVMNGVHVARRDIMQQALKLFSEHNIDFSHALVAAEMLESNQPEIYTYDHDFRKIRGITPVEP